MRSNYKTVNQTTLERRAREVAKEELEKMADELYETVGRDSTYQALAVAMWILHREFGFGGKRLTRLKDAIEDEYTIMIKKPMGMEYMPKNIMAWLKEHYGIDFEQSKYKVQDQ